MSSLASTNTDQLEGDEAKSTDGTLRPGISDVLHQKIHKFYQPDYLLANPVWEHLPRRFTVAVNRRLPPRFYLCIPFPDEEQLFVSACNLPWELLDLFPTSAYHPEFLEGRPENCAFQIAKFFVMAMKKESEAEGVLQLQYCVAADTKDLRRVPVVALKSNHSEPAHLEKMREKVHQVMEKYLFPEARWGRRYTKWMLAYETVFDEDGEVAPHLCPGCSEYAQGIDF